MYTHITRDDRICIALMLRQGKSYTEIGRELGKHRTTIIREIQRNSDDERNYRVSSAQKKTRKRRKESKREERIIENNEKIRREVLTYLKRDWSPEQITGVFHTVVSHMTIYRYLERHPSFKKNLRRRGKKRRKYGTKWKKSRYQLNKRSIHERPNYDGSIGHWEGDTIVGRERKLRIVTYVDRASGYLIANLTTAQSGDIHELVKKQFKGKLCKTITYDNGSEFALHKFIERDTGALVYFADTGKPYQRGTNENTNGLLRQYFPKGSSFATLTDRDVQRAVRKLNDRPRKRLNYRTPRQVFESVHFKS